MLKRPREPDPVAPEPKQPFWSPRVHALSTATWLPDAGTDRDVSSTRQLAPLAANTWFSVRASAPLTQPPPLNPSILQPSDAAPPPKKPRRKSTKPPKPKPPKPIRLNKDGSERKKPRPRGPPPLPPTSVRRLRLRPTPDEDKRLRLWLSAVRWTYNRCVSLVNSKACPAEQDALRQRTTTHAALTAAGKLKYLDVHVDVRSEAVRDFLKAFFQQLELVAAKKNKHFEMHYRSPRDPQQSLVVPSRDWNRPQKAKKLGPTSCKWLQGLHCAEGLPATLNNDTRLVRTRRGAYYLCVGSRPVHPAPPLPPHRVIALDPGVRTFMTGFDPEGLVLEVGFGESKLEALGKRLAKLRRETRLVADPENEVMLRGVRRRKLRRMRAKAQTWRDKQRNLVDECHKRLAKYLCESYDVILLPELKVQELVKASRVGGLHKTTKRRMLVWSHYRFRQRLAAKATQYPGKQVVFVSEAYTSRTCTRCGALAAKYSDKTFHCRWCGFACDRDVMASRNVFLRNAL